jgi:hypothetical protein
VLDVPLAFPAWAFVSMYFVSAVRPAGVDVSVGCTQPMIVISGPGSTAGLLLCADPEHAMHATPASVMNPMNCFICPP